MLRTLIVDDIYDEIENFIKVLNEKHYSYIYLDGDQELESKLTNIDILVLDIDLLEAGNSIKLSDAVDYSLDYLIKNMEKVSDFSVRPAIIWSQHSNKLSKAHKKKYENVLATLGFRPVYVSGKNLNNAELTDVVTSFNETGYEHKMSYLELWNENQYTNNGKFFDMIINPSYTLTSLVNSLIISTFGEEALNGVTNDIKINMSLFALRNLYPDFLDININNSNNINLTDSKSKIKESKLRKIRSQLLINFLWDTDSKGHPIYTGPVYLQNFDIYERYKFLNKEYLSKFRTFSVSVDITRECDFINRNQMSQVFVRGFLIAISNNFSKSSMFKNNEKHVSTEFAFNSNAILITKDKNDNLIHANYMLLIVKSDIFTVEILSNEAFNIPGQHLFNINKASLDFIRSSVLNYNQKIGEKMI